MTVRSHTSIPVPRVLDWDADADARKNPVRAEYIIMEHVSGVQLHEAWPTMDSQQHMLVTKNLAYAVAEMANLAFPVYGSLYFATHANTQQKRVDVDVDVADGFVIGPNCGREYWECGGDVASSGRNECSTNRGPCQYILYRPIFLAYISLCFAHDTANVRSKGTLSRSTPMRCSTRAICGSPPAFRRQNMAPNCRTVVQ
jgi:hypothetical protein